ncbi:uncharacterized protein LOC135466236 [Liolophura sinensis]|uniref:uncharacterized protein LOC135466236 n=1 Tax=Liolophura sinensis TaxID=3198878 RepID=UPI0031584A97
MAALTSRRVTAGGRSAFTPDGVRVHRRLDRTPELADKFRRLTPENKAKLYSLRSAVEETKLKMSRLEDDLEEKQALIEREQELRHAAEYQLRESLVDMYGDPSVTEELRQRLPHSSPHDRIRGQSLSPTGHRSPLGKMTSSGQRFDSLYGRENFLSERHQGDVRRSLDFGDSSSQRAKRESRRARRSRSLPSESSDQDMDADHHCSRRRDPRGSSHSPQGMVMLYPMAVPSVVTSLSHPQNSNVSGTPVTYIPGVVPQTVPQVTQASTAPPTGQQSFVGSHPTHSPLQSSATTCPGYVGGPNILVTPNPSVQPAPTSTLGSPTTHQVAYLLEELKLERARNNKLQEKLDRCQEELEVARRALKTKEIEKEATTSGQVSALIQDIRDAQLTRDSAVLSRLKVANQERTNMYLRLRQYGALPDQREEPSFSPEEEDEFSADEYLDLDIDSLLRKLQLQTLPKQIEAYGEAMATKISANQRRREEIVAEEMQVVLEERDLALAKCQKLEKQLNQLERKENPFCLSPSPERSLKTELAKAYNELSMSQCKVDDLEEELQTLRIYHSLRKDVLTTTEMNNTVDLYKVQLQEKDCHVDSVQKENNLLMSQLRTVNEDLMKTSAAYKESQESRERLVRLARVLKRRLNESGSEVDPV